MEKYFEYLNDLQQSGVTNMIGAPAYLIADFDLSESDATTIFVKWKKWKEEGN